MKLGYVTFLRNEYIKAFDSESKNYFFQKLKQTKTNFHDSVIIVLLERNEKFNLDSSRTFDVMILGK